MHMTHSSAAAVTASDLRSLLGRQFGEHAVLAMNATNAGVSGSPTFPAIAKSLDANSVAISKSIGSVYGAAAAKTFLDGKFMWRDHIRFFVAYTTALAKKNKAGQAKAVANLKRYTVVFGNFLATATGLPKLAVQNDLLGHVLELKNQLDDDTLILLSSNVGALQATLPRLAAQLDVRLTGVDPLDDSLESVFSYLVET